MEEYFSCCVSEVPWYEWIPLVHPRVAFYCRLIKDTWFGILVSLLACVGLKLLCEQLVSPAQTLR